MPSREDIISKLVDKAEGGLINESYDDILSDVSKEEGRCLLEMISTIHEAAVSFSKTQAYVLYSLPSDPIVDEWGTKNVPGWSKMSVSVKGNAIAQALGSSGFHAARRRAGGYENNGVMYDIPDVVDPNNAAQVVSSSLGQDLTKLFIELLLAGRSDI